MTDPSNYGYNRQSQNPSVYNPEPPLRYASSQGSTPEVAQAAETETRQTPVTYVPAASGAQSAAAVKSGGGFKTFFLAFLGALLAFAVVFGGLSATGLSRNIFNFGGSNDSGNSNSSSYQLGTTSPSIINAADEGQSLAEAVAAKALPSVVCIYVYSNQASYSNYFGYSSGSSTKTLTQSSLGSGVILTSDGYVLTNYHVIENSDALKVNVAGDEYDATVVGTDASSDLAVIKLDNASGLTAADLGDSENLTVGQWVMTIGSPFGLEQSVATGVVSATSRSQIMENSTDYYGLTSSSPTIYPNMIQTDAAINPGNSGGALVDANGKVIGINTLITSYSGNYSGVGFAIPINYAINIANQIIDGKTPTHAKLGVSLTTINSSMASRYKLSSDYGAYVSSVGAESGAAEAGMKEGDIIVAINGKKVTSATDVTLDVREHNPGDEVAVTVNRNGETEELKVVLGSDEQDLAAQTITPQDESGSTGSGRSDRGYGYGYGYSDSDIEDLFNYFFRR